MKRKKLLAVMLAAVMLLGCGITSFADCTGNCDSDCNDCGCEDGPCPTTCTACTGCDAGSGTCSEASCDCWSCGGGCTDKTVCSGKSCDETSDGCKCTENPGSGDNTGDTDNGDNGESSSGSTTEQTTTTTTNTSTSKSSSKSKSSSSGSSSSANPAAKPAGASISVGGKSVATTVNGTYEAKNVQGVAVTSAVESIRENLGLGANQTPYVTVYDTDPKKSEKAMDSINAAVEAMGGGTIAASLNIDMGAKENGKYVALENGSVGIVVGLPANVDEGATISIVCVRPGGAVTILQDTDSDPKTVTFEVQAGLGTYAIVTQ